MSCDEFTYDVHISTLKSLCQRSVVGGVNSVDKVWLLVEQRADGIHIAVLTRLENIETHDVKG